LSARRAAGASIADAGMTDWLRRNSSGIWWTVALLAVSLIVFFAGYETPYRQFGIALLTASVVLIVAMAIFETLWQAVEN
jgi:hypothetical protein